MSLSQEQTLLMSSQWPDAAYLQPAQELPLKLTQLYDERRHPKVD